MNDRFKFRAWLIDEKRYGENINLFNCCNDTIYDVEEYDDKGSHYTMYRADEVVLEQCTGLKDENGKLIYEGDIILVEDNKCPIEWESFNARYNVVGYGEIAYLNYNDIEVIGNIHENADLLEVKND